jgi:hypothetical protein
MVARIQNSPNVTRACRKRRLKRGPSAWGYNWATLSPGGQKYGDARRRKTHIAGPIRVVVRQGASNSFL